MIEEEEDYEFIDESPDCAKDVANQKKVYMIMDLVTGNWSTATRYPYFTPHRGKVFPSKDRLTAHLTQLRKNGVGDKVYKNAIVVVFGVEAFEEIKSFKNDADMKK